MQTVLRWWPHHGAAEGVGVKVAAESDDDPGVQHVSGSGLRQPEHTHVRYEANTGQSICVSLLTYRRI